MALPSRMDPNPHPNPSNPNRNPNPNDNANPNANANANPNQARCEDELDLGGFQCVWRSLHEWTKEKASLKPLVFARCANPNHHTKAECLAAGG